MPPQTAPSEPTNLWDTLGNMLTHPIRTIVPPWSWRAALFTAIFRALTFFVTNLAAGEKAALRAMAVEFAFAIVAGGLAGAVSQQLRRSEPLSATLLFIAGILPGTFVVVQLALHKLAHTPRLAGGLLLSFLLTSFSSLFSWYAMREGAMLGGADATSIRNDIRSLPGISLQFLLALPRAIMRRVSPK